MPIEIQIEKLYGKNLPTAEVLQKARAYALEQIDRQRAGFIRLGVLGEWDNPYMTMAYSNEADELRALGTLLEKGYVYRGLKPVNWCFDCGSALAEAEVEYQDKSDPAIDVGFPFAEPEKIAAAFGLPTLPAGDGFIVIWTTTPWTIPSNQALNVHPEVQLRAGADRTRRQAAAADPGCRPGRIVPGALQARRHGDRHQPGRQAGRHQLQAPAARGRTRSTTASRRCTWPTT